MKFNVSLPEDTRDYLEHQYKEYIRVTPMIRKGMRALREWVKNGNSVYDNPAGAWQDGQVPVEFLDIYRDDEYLRSHTKDMFDEESHRFTLTY